MCRKISIISMILAMVLLVQSSIFTVYSVESQSEQTAVKSINKISTELLNRYESIDSSSVVPVAVWVSDIDVVQVSKAVALEAIGMTESEFDEYIESGKNDGLLQKYIEAKREYSSTLYQKYNAMVNKTLFYKNETRYISKYSPVIIANISKDRALEIALSESVVALDYYNLGYDMSDDLLEFDTEAISSTMTISQINQITNVDDAHSASWLTENYTGEGVKIGVIELSLPTLSYFNDYNIEEVDINAPYTPNLPNQPADPVVHANVVLNVITSVAPDATYYLTATGVYEEEIVALSRIEWLIDRGVNVINSSRTYDADAELNSYEFYSKWIDHIAIIHDLHFVKSSGNRNRESDRGITAGGMSYNAVTVGNLDTKGTVDLGDDEIDSDSSYNHNNSVLAYKPDIVAPGNISTDFGLASGTSLSTPQVTGIIALLCENLNVMKIRPDLVKAVLAASFNSATNRSYTPSMPEYRQYGAGLVDAAAVCMTKNESNYRPGRLNYTRDYSEIELVIPTYYMRLRIAMAFSVSTTLTNESDHGASNVSVVTPGVANLDLLVYQNGNLIASSSTANNNLEIVDIPVVFEEEASEVIYTIRIVRTSSVDENTFYGLAWSTY